MASRGFPGTWRCCTTATGVWALGQARCRLVTLRPSLVENRLARWLPKGLHRGYGVSACRSRRQVLPRCLDHRQEWVRSRTLGLNSKLASAISMHRHVVVSFKCCFVDHFGTRSVCRLMTVAHASQHGDCRAEIRRRKYSSWATAPAFDLVAAMPISQRTNIVLIPGRSSDIARVFFKFSTLKLLEFASFVQTSIYRIRRRFVCSGRKQL